jgi:hypothetical protein
MAYYDVAYISPLNIKGTLRAFQANNAEEAAKLAATKITSSSQYSPDDFNIIEVKLVPHIEPQIENEIVGE